MGNACEGYDKDSDNACFQGGDVNCTRDACNQALAGNGVSGGSCCPASAAQTDKCECMCGQDLSYCPGGNPYPPDPPGPGWLPYILTSRPFWIVVVLLACCVTKCFVDDSRHRQRMKRMQQSHGSLLAQPAQLKQPQGYLVYGDLVYGAIDEEAWVVPACPVVDVAVQLPPGPAPLHGDVRNIPANQVAVGSE